MAALMNQESSAHHFKKFIHIAVRAQANGHAGLQHFLYGSYSAAHLAVGQRHGDGLHAFFCQDGYFLISDLYQLGSQDVSVQASHAVICLTGVVSRCSRPMPVQGHFHSYACEAGIRLRLPFALLHVAEILAAGKQGVDAR